MSDAVQIPPRPNLYFYRTLARDLRKAVARDTVGDWAARWITNLSKLVALESFGDRSISHEQFARGIEGQWQRFVDEQPPIKSALPSIHLTDAQFFIARIHGFAS